MNQSANRIRAFLLNSVSVTFRQRLGKLGNCRWEDILLVGQRRGLPDAVTRKVELRLDEVKAKVQEFFIWNGGHSDATNHPIIVVLSLPFEKSFKLFFNSRYRIEKEDHVLADLLKSEFLVAKIVQDSFDADDRHVAPGDCWMLVQFLILINWPHQWGCLLRTALTCSLSRLNAFAKK